MGSVRAKVHCRSGRAHQGCGGPRASSATQVCAARSCSGVPGPSCGPMACQYTGVMHVFVCFHHLELLFRDYFSKYVLNILFQIKFGCIVYSQ